MFAAAAGFGGADDTETAAGDDEMRVFFHGRQGGAVGNFEGEALERDERLGLRRFGAESVVLQTFGEMGEALFEFTPENRGDAEAAQIASVHGSVEAVAAEVSGGVELAQRRDEFCSKAGGGVHGKVDGDQTCGADGICVELLAGQVEASDVVAAPAKPGGGRDEAERLAAKFIGRDEKDVHGFNSIAGAALRRIVFG